MQWSSLLGERFAQGGVRALRFCKLVAQHPRMPRWLAGAMVVCLAIPGPVDEVLLAIAIGGLLVARREVVTDSWRMSARKEGA